ncbi:glucosamine-6-phosphate deaminase [Aneurinibacillus thermoaerophilus]|uniref:Glucosamine-6-phosphate deaminase n=1 Tax=Aneurinibacillus thermoaerophilus TaxID=143495 RepID=A0A1G7XNJ5_ANETH|nr:glucosamine-6-phosphate deaminase [Aneurinibacillus thermoaerophilus]MED0679561.1 glucosamine-6-phosphate deaminase [Aneurinibacillus thermoaerophilus]MED0737439.1 glucosamine-6-phosphate deaminase [Aneurinibacillus thermoaerophilus]MED0756289.1 glucosamine-6-phosphate deaminase [Aneurinibacillus thermoaerophilus]MED0760276.1 glucosamine-6-phosphate deaminase [Aneurinibacillus thermoaerophilus]MED0765012.1 glucosamine-6-phosphate deaminase [Aneurinibacillus thermoaerophilus]
MDIRIFSTAREGAIYSATVIEQIIKNRAYPVLGLATGSTPIPLYYELIRMHQWGLDFSRVTTINLDEYVGISADHPQSYRYFMKRYLFDHVNIDQSRTYIPRGDAEDLEQECQRYDQIIQLNPIDIQILGIGINGHIGFNEPDVSLKSKTHIVKLAHVTIQANARFFESPGEVPEHAITMGLQSILLSKQILLLAFGEEKAQAVVEAVYGDVRTSLPASILQLHPNVTFVLDEAAAALLLKREKNRG